MNKPFALVVYILHSQLVTLSWLYLARFHTEVKKIIVDVVALLLFMENYEQTSK
jgi:hypothetical protein